MKQTFGQILKETRRAKNISQRELAIQAGVDFTYISKLENDKLPPPAVDTVLKLADLLNTPQELFLASSGKVENEIRDTIAGSTEAVKFLNEAKQMRLTNDEWDQLSRNLKKLR